MRIQTLPQYRAYNIKKKIPIAPSVQVFQWTPVTFNPSHSNQLNFVFILLHIISKQSQQSKQGKQSKQRVIQKPSKVFTQLAYIRLYKKNNESEAIHICIDG